MAKMPHVPRIAFLPGAAGAPEFWLPVAQRLPEDWPKTLMGWPGAGDQPHDPRVRGFDDLIALAATRVEAQSDLIAQSMGGVVAIGLALRHPEKVRRLVLVATSGGIDAGSLDGEDWRPEYEAEFPDAAQWVTQQRLDYTSKLSTISAPTCLIWGDADPISTLAVGRRLHGALRSSTLHVIAGGTHAMARDRPREIAALITDHLKSGV